MALAVHLANSGRNVCLVRTGGKETAEASIDVSVEDNGTFHRAVVACTSIAKLKNPKGLLVIAAKAFANAEISKALLRSGASGPIALLQNGLGVERPFIDAGFPEIYRAVLYVTGQRDSTGMVSFHAVKPSVLGIVSGKLTDDILGLEPLISTCLATVPFSSRPIRRFWLELFLELLQVVSDGGRQVFELKIQHGKRRDHPSPVPIGGVAADMAAAQQGDEEVSAAWVVGDEGIALFLGQVEGIVESGENTPVNRDTPILE